MVKPNEPISADDDKPIGRNPIFAVEEEVFTDHREWRNLRKLSPDRTAESIPRKARFTPIVSSLTEKLDGDFPRAMLLTFEDDESEAHKEELGRRRERSVSPSTGIQSPVPVARDKDQADDDKTEEKEGSTEPPRPVSSGYMVMSQYQPPDGGWGWVCVVVCFLDFLLIDGLARSYGAIYDDIREEYPTASHSEIAMAPSVFTTLYIGLGIVAGALSQRFSFRYVALAGGLLCGASVSLVYFASTLPFLIGCFVFAGIGSAMLCTSSMLCVTMYFRYRRALATGLSISGTSIGSIVQPPLVKYLTQLFGFRVALACVGIVFLVAAPTAMLLRDPLSQQSRRTSAVRTPSRTKDYLLHTSPSTIHASIYLDRELPPGPVFSPEMTPRSPSPVTPRESLAIGPRLSQLVVASPDQSESQSTAPSELPTPREAPSPLITREPSQERQPTLKPILRKGKESGARAEKKSAQKGKKVLRFTLEPTESESTSSSSYESRTSLSVNHRFSRRLSDVSNASSADSSIRTWSPKETPSITLYSSPQSIDSNQSAGNFLLFQFRTHGEARYAVYEQTTRSRTLLWIKRYCRLDFAFMRNPVFLVVLVSATMIFCSLPGALIFLVPYTTSKGIDETIGSLLLSASAVGDLISRLCSGILLDKALFPKQYAFIAGMITLGCTTLLMVCYSHVAYLAVVAGVYGLSTGLCVLSIPILLADHHGAHNLPSVYGIVRIGMAIMCLISPPVSGALRDATGNFVLSFVFMGGGTLLGAVVAFALSCVKASYKRHLERDIKRAHERGEHFYL